MLEALDSDPRRGRYSLRADLKYQLAGALQMQLKQEARGPFWREGAKTGFFFFCARQAGPLLAGVQDC